MQVLFYASGNDRDKNRLEAAIHDAVPGRAIELFTRLDALRERFRFIVEPDSIAVLLAADGEEIREIYVILVIPDWQESTVKLAHLLWPRFLNQKADRFTDLIIRRCIMNRFFYVLAWLWMIIVGGLLITPGGIFCIVCGATIDASGFIEKLAVFVIGIVSIVIGIIGLVTLKKKWVDESWAL